MTRSAALCGHDCNAKERVFGRVLITGAGGFLGAAITDALLAQNVDITASDIGPVASMHDEMVACEVTDFDRVDAVVAKGNFDTILHCGAVSGPMVMPDRPLDIWRINAGGTANVLEAARRQGVERVLICSTSEVYGEQSGRVDEATLPLTGTVYGASKLAGEQVMMGYVREHGVDAIALRLSWIYGPGRQTPTTLERLLRRTLAGRGSHLDVPADSYTHYIHIEDAVQGVVRAATVKESGARVLNISAGRGVAMAEIAEIVRGLHPGVAITCAPPVAAARGISEIDISLAARDIGYRPRVPLSDGLAGWYAALKDDQAVK
ncbi:MAG: NAD(P)-dependent oxidoreductase [Roseovarius sp.]|uniref:NAD-dependent epimerase/dehydratase family protein n=1 Tax=Roseobacteraceae TaxID=2854170 RepID=UPI0032EDF2AF